MGQGCVRGGSVSVAVWMAAGLKRGDVGGMGLMSCIQTHSLCIVFCSISCACLNQKL